VKKLLFVILLFPLFLSAQKSKLEEDNLRLRSKVDSLEKKLDDKYYTRVPNADFDNKLNETVADKVGDYIKGKVALSSSIIAVISFLLGFLAKYYFSENTRKQIDENVNKIREKVSKDNEEGQKKLDSLFNQQKEFLTSTNELYDHKIDDLDKRFENFRTAMNDRIQSSVDSTNKIVNVFQINSDGRLKQMEDQFTKMIETTQSMVKAVQATQENFEKVSADKIDNKFAEAFDFLWGDVVGSMMDRAKEQGYNGLNLIADFERILKKELELKVSVELMVKVIDTLMRCYYHTAILENGVDKRYDRMVKLIRDYEDKYQLLPETYANAAIGLTNNYELFGTNDLLDAAIANCDKSIQRNRDYGLPYALKMELYTIAPTKTRDQDLKDKYKEQIQALFYLIDRIPSPLLKGSFLERLIADKKIGYLETYIEQLYKDYSKELTPFRENVVEQLVRNYGKAVEYEKKLYSSLLSEGLNLHPNLDGTWKAISFIKDGSSIDLTNNTILLVLKASTYSFSSDAGYHENGVIYFLPHLTPYSFLLVPTDPKDKVKTIKGFYEIDEVKKELTWCLAPEDKERPQDFTSTVDNMNSLLTFQLQ
jgi:uncharacterized protein (TIGR03067 family)